MYYSRWSTKEEIKDCLLKIKKGEVQKSGVPILYEDNDCYINNNDYQTLIIGSNNSGKTECITKNVIELAISANENIVVNDGNDILYKSFYEKLKENGYTNIVINFNNVKDGNNFNPLELPYTLYKNNKKDKAIEILEKIGYYIFTDTKNTMDPFWENSSINYFIGIVLYLFETETKENINLNKVHSFAMELNDSTKAKEILEKINEKGSIFLNLSSILNAPSETKGSIISVCSQKLTKYTSKVELSEMISYNNFDITNFSKNKTALFIIGNNDTNYKELISLIISEIHESIKIYNNKIRTIFMLEDFDCLYKVKEIDTMLNNANRYNISYILTVSNFKNLINTYGKELSEIIKFCCPNIIYLLSNDEYTLAEISTLCGNQNINMPLISTDELKRLNYYEAIVLLPREMPFKTNLTPKKDIF